MHILLDECHLTNVRTAAAGAVVAKYLAPKKVERIGVFGARVQGKMQVEALLPIVDCRDVVVWGTGEEELEAYCEALSGYGVEIQTTESCDEIAATCNLIVDPALQRTADSQITVADLTGVAVQDIQISKAVYQVLSSGPPSG